MDQKPAGYTYFSTITVIHFLINIMRQVSPQATHSDTALSGGCWRLEVVGEAGGYWLRRFSSSGVFRSHFSRANQKLPGKQAFTCFLLSLSHWNRHLLVVFFYRPAAHNCSGEIAQYALAPKQINQIRRH